jgi:hypothetical protein
MSYETLESRAGKGPQVERVRRLFSIMAQTTWFGVITEVPFGVRITTNFNNGLFVRRATPLTPSVKEFTCDSADGFFTPIPY